MSQNIYEIAALGARYVFAALMVLIVLRAWRITIVDSRRADTLRRMSPQTGLSGELVVLEGDERKARRGMRYPVIREGMIGSSRRADIRIRHSSVRRRHAYFQLTEDGLSLRTHAGAVLMDGQGEPVRSLLLEDGDAFILGRVRLLLVLTAEPEDIVASPPPRRRGRHNEEIPEDEAEPAETSSDASENDPEGLFDTEPEPQQRPRRRRERRPQQSPRPQHKPRFRNDAPDDAYDSYDTEDDADDDIW